MKKFLYSSILIVLLAACSSSDENTTSAIDPNNVNANISGEAYSTRYEIPHLGGHDDTFFTYTTSSKDDVTYSISYNRELKHARWVAFTFNESNRVINWNRNDWGKDPWDYAPEVPEEDQLDSRRGIVSTYGLNGYDRGHIVASYDRLHSQEANRQTFYSVNMSPMLSSFNQDGPWNKLETKINNRSSGWCTTNDVLYVVKGATIREGEYNVKNTLTIPKNYFMAIVRKKGNSHHGIAFLLPHDSNTGRSLRSCAMSIDELEEITGIDFFCNIPDKLENAVEKTINTNAWGL